MNAMWLAMGQQILMATRVSLRGSLAKTGKFLQPFGLAPEYRRQDLNNDGYPDNPMATVLSGTWSWRP